MDIKRRPWLVTGLGIVILLLGVSVILGNDDAFPKVMGVIASLAGLVLSLVGLIRLSRGRRAK